MKKNYVTPKTVVIQMEGQLMNFSVNNEQTYEMGAKNINSTFQYDEEDNNNE